jgi:hypothetical protein
MVGRVKLMGMIEDGAVEVYVTPINLQALQHVIFSFDIWKVRRGLGGSAQIMHGPPAESGADVSSRSMLSLISLVCVSFPSAVRAPPRAPADPGVAAASRGHR